MKAVKNLFKKRFGDFYKPDNSEEDIYLYSDFEELCEESWQESRVMQELFESPHYLLDYLIRFIDWEYPETFIEGLKNLD